MTLASAVRVWRAFLAMGLPKWSWDVGLVFEVDGGFESETDPRGLGSIGRSRKRKVRPLSA